MDELDPVVTVNDVAKYFKVSRSTIFKAIKSGALKSYKFGRQRRIKREWVLEYQNGLLKKAGYCGEDVFDHSLMIDDPVHLKEINGLHINQFSQETQDFIHHLCANAIKRAINNGYIKTK
ncbi:MAG: helix-turn-helix domain-containing protein [Paenibacillus macerans]|uniref:helix-turn-helix domain-containing protein n=1 Tax=Paenibacillus macerans TaxID=44252 RepID=UPI00242FD42B|nr:helix-turn-helix domain-containing protein [Paenibacillus macerans]MBS5910731.1 helix-turn-helix domain-containing protein [Paenibacillus macerans]MDU5945679.1 helix-turn-helix domain-containing protein [Paenibacillus macerans]